MNLPWKHRFWLTVLFYAGLYLLIRSYPVMRSASFPAAPCLSEEVQKQIEFGMSLQQVNAIVGAAPGDYTTTTVLYGGLQNCPEFRYPLRPFSAPGRDWPHLQISVRIVSRKEWITNTGKIEVWLDANGQVAGKVFNTPGYVYTWRDDRLNLIFAKLGLNPWKVVCLN